MALFQNRPQLSTPLPFTTIGLNKTILLVGLGNPGKEYDNTRHNIGFMAVDYFVAKTTEMSDWIEKKDLKSWYSSGNLGQTRVIAIKPTTFMNHSGEAVQAAASFFKVPIEHIVVLHDELDIDFGTIRIRRGGESAGHNGIKSITQHVGEATGRIRIGIGPKKPTQIDSTDFVLATFNNSEQAQLANLYREVTAILSEYFYSTQLVSDTRSFII